MYENAEWLIPARTPNATPLLFARCVGRLKLEVRICLVPHQMRLLRLSRNPFCQRQFIPCRLIMTQLVNRSQIECQAMEAMTFVDQVFKKSASLAMH